MFIQYWSRTTRFLPLICLGWLGDYSCSSTKDAHGQNQALRAWLVEFSGRCQHRRVCVQLSCCSIVACGTVGPDSSSRIHLPKLSPVKSFLGLCRTWSTSRVESVKGSFVSSFSLTRVPEFAFKWKLTLVPGFSSRLVDVVIRGCCLLQHAACGLK